MHKPTLVILKTVDITETFYRCVHLLKSDVAQHKLVDVNLNSENKNTNIYHCLFVALLYLIKKKF